jgi:transcriptional repressor NrdR
MLCPFCGSEDTQVKDSRPAEDGNAIRRRRLCGSCGARFTTFERVQLREINVVKRSGRRSVFDRDKLERSFQIALRKRDVNADDVARSINEIVRQLESHPDGDVPSAHVGELVMDTLAKLDQVAYVRYASVYRNFREAKDFEAFVEKELGD